jgi:predicted site-specific integrase-resolvase
MRLFSAARRYGVDAQTLRRWGRLGIIRLHRVPGTRPVFVDVAELDRVIEQRTA